MVRFDLGPLLQGQMRIGKLRSAYNSLIIGPGSKFGLKRNDRVFGICMYYVYVNFKLNFDVKNLK